MAQVLLTDIEKLKLENFELKKSNLTHETEIIRARAFQLQADRENFLGTFCQNNGKDVKAIAAINISQGYIDFKDDVDVKIISNEDNNAPKG